MRPIVSPADQQCAQVNASIHRIQAISARNIQLRAGHGGLAGQEHSKARFVTRLAALRT